MNRTIRLSQILVYYDVPELFLGKDSVGSNYLCLLSATDTGLKYLSILISNQRLSELICGLVDLKPIFENPEITEHYVLDEADQGVYAISETIEGIIHQDFMPLEGLLLSNPFNDHGDIIEETIEKQNSIVHLAISDSKDDLGIQADDLGDIMKFYSLLVENSFKKVVHQRKLPYPKSLIIPKNYKLRAFTSSAASFNVHLYSESDKDLFGNNMIEFALEKIDQLLDTYDSEDDLLRTLRTIKGHGVSSFSRILKKISSDNLKIKHKWFAPNRETVRVRILDKSRADNLLRIIGDTIELSEEIRSFNGYFLQVDLPRKTWRLRTTEGDIEIYGTANSDQLGGVVIEKQEYHLVCEEVIEEFKVSEKEKISYVLKDLNIAGQRT